MANRQRSRSTRTSNSTSGNQAAAGSPGSVEASEQAQDSALLRASFDTGPFEDPTRTQEESTIPKATFVGEQIIYKDREARIAELAYLRAEQRGFAAGFEVEDWLAAEKEVDAVLSSASDSVRDSR